MRSKLFPLLLGLACSGFALAEGVNPTPPSSLQEDPSSLGGNGAVKAESSRAVEYRNYGPTFEHISPRMGLYTDPKTRLKVPLLPYGVFSRKDSEISKLLDYDCVTFDPDFAESLRKRDPERFYFLPKEPRKEERSQKGDDFCFQSTFYLPMSSLKATQIVAQKLRQAWMRLEERTFFNTYVRLNTPWSPFVYCTGLMNSASRWIYSALGTDGRAPIPPAVNHIPQELLPEELGGDLYNQLLEFTSSYRLDVRRWLESNLGVNLDSLYPGYGIPENTPNYSAASKGQFRSTYYFPFLPPPWLPTTDYCDGGFNLMPIIYIPAIRLQIAGFTIWTSDGYPDIPMIMDEGEAERRIKESIRKMYAEYYPEYLREALSLALPFVSLWQTRTPDPDSSLKSYESNINTYLNDAKDILEELNGGGSSISVGDLGQIARTLAGIFELDGLYFPTPWQLPLLGGGAAVTPVYEYIYPDPIRSSVDLYAIFDAVSTLAKSENFTDLERLGLFLYYLQPALHYLDTPIFPWLPNSPTAGLFLKPVLDVGFSVATSLAQKAVDATLQVLDSAAEAAFGKEAGAAFSALVKVLLLDLIRLPSTTSPKMFVDQALAILRKIDSTAEAFGGGRGWWAKDSEMKHMIAPGIFRFEELKRVFPVSNPFLQYAFGYTTLFLAWDEVAGGIMPDPFNASWNNPFEYIIAALSRLIGFWHVPFTINIVFGPPWVIITPDIPRYMPLAPYWTPYVLDRIAWGWVNVPEGYPIPYAKGVPGALLPDIATGGDNASATASEASKFASAVAAPVMDLYKKILFPEKVFGGGK